MQLSVQSDVASRLFFVWGAVNFAIEFLLLCGIVKIVRAACAGIISVLALVLCSRSLIGCLRPPSAVQ